MLSIRKGEPTVIGGSVATAQAAARARPSTLRFEDQGGDDADNARHFPATSPRRSGTRSSDPVRVP